MKSFLITSGLVLFTNFCVAQNNNQNAQEILNIAFKKAAKENKNVFVIFHASWCGWCKRMDKSMEDINTKNYFENNYVTIHLTVQETPQNKKLETHGADLMLTKYKGEKEGLPFFVILNPKGNLLGDSFVDGSNIGCPAKENEVTAFVALLKKSSNMADEGLKIIAKRFRENEEK